MVSRNTKITSDSARQRNIATPFTKKTGQSNRVQWPLSLRIRTGGVTALIGNTVERDTHGNTVRPQVQRYAFRRLIYLGCIQVVLAGPSPFCSRARLMYLTPQNHSSNPQRFALNQDPALASNYNILSHPGTPPRSDHTNSNGVSQSQSKPGENFDPSYLSPRRGLRPGLNGSRSGSEADSLLELYGHPRSLGEKSVANSMDRERGLLHEELSFDDDDSERSRWIHRDKLAIIESHEMQEAGIKLPRPQTSSSTKSRSRREPVHNVPDIHSQELETSPSIEHDKRRTQSPTRQEDDGEETLVNNFDLRTPEEIAADKYLEASPNVYRQPDPRKSSSRIPLPRSSPMPIPQEHIERDTPLPRKRGASGNWTGEENGISYNRVRSRGNSVGSQVLLDDPEAKHNTPTSSSRPGSRDSLTKSRIPSGKPTHARKPSITNTTPTFQPKPRQPSATNSPRTPSSTQRPKSRSSLDPRPTTALNRPEGEPPWLATMYKPDPRLPQDQQLLPTHAKRLQQEQWERAQKDSEQRGLDGKTSPQLPIEFSPLAEHTVNGLQPSSREADETGLQEKAGAEWPLAPSQVKGKGAASPTALPEIGTQHAGYSTIPPRVKQGESPVSQLGNNQRPLDPFEKERLARAEKEKGGGGGGGGAADEKGKKEKGCGCCIVM